MILALRNAVAALLHATPAIPALRNAVRFAILALRNALLQLRLADAAPRRAIPAILATPAPLEIVAVS